MIILSNDKKMENGRIFVIIYRYFDLTDNRLVTSFRLILQRRLLG